MGKELSRRDFLKAAALGLGAAFLAACSKNKNERCNDPQHSVTLRPGDYVNVGNIEFKIITTVVTTAMILQYLNLRIDKGMKFHMNRANLIKSIQLGPLKGWWLVKH